VEETGGDSFLPVGSGILVIVGSNERTEHRTQVGAALVVQGAWLVIAPECSSQTACGILHSAAGHGRATASRKFTIARPLSCAIESKEGSQEELLLVGA
jgi:hypothetical protein